VLTVGRSPRAAQPSRRLACGVAVAAAVAVVAAGCGSAPDGPGTGEGCRGPGAVARDQRYARDPGVTAGAQSLDLYLPERAAGARCAAAPVVVYVHGGGLQVGDKANQVAGKAALFTGEGWAFASVNYRLVGEPAAGPPGATFPRAEHDVARAIAHLRARAADDGLDAANVMLLGHSAGAFLAALVGTDAGFLDAAAPGAGLDAVTCVAPIDTSYDIPAGVAAGGTNAAAFVAAFGHEPAVWRAASPTHVVSGLGAAGAEALPRFHVVTRGTASRVAEAQAFGAAVEAAGGHAEVIVTRGLDHEGVNDAIGAPGDAAVTPALTAFYRACLR
jgi:acetyl esterase/lipase